MRLYDGGTCTNTVSTSHLYSRRKRKEEEKEGKKKKSRETGNTKEIDALKSERQ